MGGVGRIPTVPHLHLMPAVPRCQQHPALPPRCRCRCLPLYAVAFGLFYVLSPCARRGVWRTLTLLAAISSCVSQAGVLLFVRACALWWLASSPAWRDGDNEPGACGFFLLSPLLPWYAVLRFSLVERHWFSACLPSCWFGIAMFYWRNAFWVALPWQHKLARCWYSSTWYRQRSAICWFRWFRLGRGFSIARDTYGDIWRVLQFCPRTADIAVTTSRSCGIAYMSSVHSYTIPGHAAAMAAPRFFCCAGCFLPAAPCRLPAHRDGVTPCTRNTDGGTALPFPRWRHRAATCRRLALHARVTSPFVAASCRHLARLLRYRRCSGHIRLDGSSLHLLVRTFL